MSATRVYGSPRGSPWNILRIVPEAENVPRAHSFRVTELHGVELNADALRHGLLSLVLPRLPRDSAPTDKNLISSRQGRVNYPLNSSIPALYHPLLQESNSEIIAKGVWENRNFLIFDELRSWAVFARQFASFFYPNVSDFLVFIFFLVINAINWNSNWKLVTAEFTTIFTTKNKI